LSKVKIALDGHGHGTISVDGEEIKRVRSFLFSAGVGEMNILNIAFIHDEVEIEANAEVYPSMSWPFPPPEPQQTPRGPDQANQYGHLRNPN